MKYSGYLSLGISQECQYEGHLQAQSIPIYVQHLGIYPGCMRSCSIQVADIIYELAQSAENISDESRSSLENEFCRKYGYLCMVRHPKSVAYGFKIEEGLEE